MLLVAAAAAGFGCETVSDTIASYQNQPTQTQRALGGPPTPIAVANLASPKRAPVPISDIGSGAADALARDMLERNQFDVWMGPKLSANLASPHPNIDRIRKDHPELRYLVTGRVTDFVQTNDLPEHLRPAGWFGGRKKEAVVALDLQIVDLKTGRVIATDLIPGRADVPSGASSDMYKHVSFGSHLFWSTPLGRATRHAVSNAADRIAQSLPARLENPRIAKKTAPRRLRIDGGRVHGLKPGQEYHILRASDDRDASSAIVLDRVTERPVIVRIDEVRQREATAWLLGQPSAEVDLRGLRLRRMTGTPMRTATVGTDGGKSDDG